MDSAADTNFQSDYTLDQLCNELLHNWLPNDRKEVARVCASAARTKPIAARRLWPDRLIGAADRIVQQPAAQEPWFHRLLRCHVVVEYALRTRIGTGRGRRLTPGLQSGDDVSVGGDRGRAVQRWLWTSRRGRAVRAWLWTFALLFGTVGFVVGHFWPPGWLIVFPSALIVVWLVPREIARWRDARERDSIDGMT
jgi:hypothetical protein